jgi:hypothetical protein
MMRGKVTNIPSSETAYGTMYNVEVDGKKFGFGKYPPKNFKVGDYVEFDVDNTNPKYPKMNYKSVKIVEPPSEPASTVRTGGNVGGYSRGGFNDDKRQEVISKQAARNSAIAALEFLGKHGALPAAPAKAKPSDLFDLYSGLIDEFTQKYYDYSMGKVAPTIKPEATIQGAESVEEDQWGGNE